MTKHAITAILTFSILLVWNLDFAYGFVGAGLLGLSYLVILLLFASLLLTSIFRKRIKASLILSGHLAAILLSIHVSVALKSFKTQNTEKRGETIVNAIKKYRKAEEKYPNNAYRNGTMYSSYTAASFARIAARRLTRRHRRG